MPPRCRSLLFVTSTLACAAPPAERPAAPPVDPEAGLHAAREQELHGLPCPELVERTTIMLSPRGVETLAGLLLRRCLEPAAPQAGDPTAPPDDHDPIALRERAADRFFRELPSQLPAYQDGVYAFLDDPRAVALARQLFPHFLAHTRGRDGKDGAQPLAEWAPHAALYRRLALTCDDLRALAPDTGAALELWLRLRADARCPAGLAADAHRSALAGTTSGRAVACSRLAELAPVPESELLRAALSDPGEHEHRPTRTIALGELVIPIRYEPSSSRYPGRAACLRALATRHAALVTRVVVDSPTVTMTVAYVGRPRAVVVFTADRDGAPTPGWVASSDPQVPPELAALVAGAWPKKQLKPATMSIHPLTDRTIVPGGLRFGAPEPDDGPHFWELVLRRLPLPPKLAVLVLDEDGTIRRATDR